MELIQARIEMYITTKNRARQDFYSEKKWYLTEEN